MASFGRVTAILAKELRQLRRDRLTFAMIVGIPLMQVLLFGFAINLDVRHLRAGVVDLAGTQSSRALALDAQATQVIDLVAQPASVPELEALLDRGELSVGIVIPPDFERRLHERDRPAAQLLVDGSEPAVPGVITGLARLPSPLRAAPDPAPAELFALRILYNPEQRSAVQVVPALIGVILHATMVLFTAVALARERERGNLELLIATPVRSWELMVGKIAPYVLIGLFQATLILLIGVGLFGVPVWGSLLDLYLACLLFVAATLGLGLLISTVAATQFQAMQLSVFTILPSILLSGFMFPFDGMPWLAQHLGELIPLTHFVRLVRGIVLRGAPLSGMLSEVWALLAFFALVMSAALLRFRKRLD